MTEGQSVSISTGVNWSSLSELVHEQAMERASRALKPDITIKSLEKERRQGIHQGVWEVVAKMLMFNPSCAEHVVNALSPDPKFIHEFDWENLTDHFGSKDKAKQWLSSFASVNPSPLEQMVPHASDADVVGKKGDRIEGDTARQGRDYGIGEALLESYLVDELNTTEVMRLDLYVPVKQMHYLTIGKSIVKKGCPYAFKQFMDGQD